MINFSCPNCNRRLKAADSRIGATLPCPACKNEVIVPSRSDTPANTDDGQRSILDWLSEGQDSRPANSLSQTPKAPDEPRSTEDSLSEIDNESSSNPQVKQCPYCAETIHVAARKCRFCGEFLDGRKISSTPTPNLVAPTPHSATIKQATSFAGGGCALQGLALVCFLVAVMLLFNASILAAIIAGILGLWLYFFGGRLATWLECSSCGGRLANAKVKTCPHCRATFRHGN